MRRTTLAVLFFVALLAAGCSSAPTAANEEAVRRMVQAINARDFGALDDLVAPNVHRHSAATPGVTVESLEQFKQMLQQDLSTFPDARQDLVTILSKGDLVALRAIYLGTQQGPLGPYPATGKPIEIPFLAILRLEHGKIAEIWVEWDNLNILSQLGYAPSPGGESATGR